MFLCFSSRRRHTRCGRDWSSDVCSSDLALDPPVAQGEDVEDLTLERLVFHRVDARSARAQHNLLAAAGELECFDLAALLEPPAEPVDLWGAKTRFARREIVDLQAERKFSHPT